MVDIRKIGIKRRKTYRLDARKKYQHVRSFKVKKKEPIDKIRDSVKKLFAKKPKKVKKKQAAKPGFNFLLIGGAIALAILLLLGAWMYFTLQIVTPAQQPSTPIQPKLDNEIVKKGVITAGDRTMDEYTDYARVYTRSQGINNYTVKVTPYMQKVPSEIFVLLSPRQQAEGYPVFIQALRNELEKKNRALNEIDIAQLEDAPNGAIVIVPSGNIPQELLGVESNTDVVKLMDKGFVIVYIGLPFTSMLDGNLVVTTPEEILDDIGIIFLEGGAPPSTDGFEIYQPLYGVGGGAGMLSRKAYGSVSIVTKGDGAIVFLPQTLDGGWPRNMKGAAANITKLILETEWADAIADTKTYEISDPSSEQLVEFFSLPIEETEGSMKIEWTARDESGNILKEEWQSLIVKKETLSELYVEGGYAVTPTYISGDTVRMNVKFNEPSPGTRFMFLSIANSTGEVGDRLSIGQVNLIGETPIDPQIQLDTGEYIASIIDEESKVYAQTYLQILSVDILYVGQEERGIYNFEIWKGDDRESLDIEVSVDDGEYGTYSFIDATDLSINLLDKTGGDDLPYGEHTFTFNLGEVEKTVLVTRNRPRSFFDDPIFIATIVLALGIIGGGFYFARKEEVAYQLDIPDFPPVARTKIPLRSETILGLFAKINQDYKWNSVPLSISEIKNGFKTIFHKGKPILISDYNTEYIMDKMKNKNLIGSFLDYYVPVSWEKKAGKGIRYLCLFRRLRDIFVNNAVPFTLRGQESDCSTKINIVGQEMYVHLFDGFEKAQLSGVVLNSLKTVRKGISIIIFSNEEEKTKFEAMMASTSQALLLLKMEVESGSILLHTHKEFEKMIKEFKTF